MAGMSHTTVLLASGRGTGLEGETWRCFVTGLVFRGETLPSFGRLVVDSDVVVAVEVAATVLPLLTVVVLLVAVVVSEETSSVFILARRSVSRGSANCVRSVRYSPWVSTND